MVDKTSHRRKNILEERPKFHGQIGECYHLELWYANLENTVVGVSIKTHGFAFFNGILEASKGQYITFMEEHLSLEEIKCT